MECFGYMTIRKTNFYNLQCITVLCNVVHQILLMKLHSSFFYCLIESQGYSEQIFITLQCLLPKLPHWLMSYLAIISPRTAAWLLFLHKSTVLCNSKQQHWIAACQGQDPGCYRETAKACPVFWPLPPPALPCGHQWCCQEQPGKYQKWLQSPRGDSQGYGGGCRWCFPESCWWGKRIIKKTLWHCVSTISCP